MMFAISIAISFVGAVLLGLGLVAQRTRLTIAGAFIMSAGISLSYIA